MMILRQILLFALLTFSLQPNKAYGFCANLQNNSSADVGITIWIVANNPDKKTNLSTFKAARALDPYTSTGYAYCWNVEKGKGTLTSHRNNFLFVDEVEIYNSTTGKRFHKKLKDKQVPFNETIDVIASNNKLAPRELEITLLGDLGMTSKFVFIDKD